MAVARLGADAVGKSPSYQNSAAMSYTVSAGTDRILILAVGWEHEANITIDTVTYGGQTCIEIGQISEFGGGFSNGASLWYILDAGIAAASGTAIVTDYSVAQIELETIVAAAYSAVDQTGGATTIVSSVTQANANPIVLDLTEASGDLVVAAMGNNTESSTSWSAAMTEQQDEISDDSGFGFTWSYADGLSSTAANVDIEATGAGSPTRTSGISARIAQEAGGGGVTIPLLLNSYRRHHQQHHSG